MKINNLCKMRNIEKLDIETPLLIPSFSSTIYGINDKSIKNEIGTTYNFIKEKLTNQLISLFDIQHKYLDIEELIWPPLTILDSGCYESECYIKAGHDIKWSYENYNIVLNDLTPKKQCILVNYDSYDEINKQIKNAVQTFENKVEYISDFLLKPIKRFGYIDKNYIINNIDKISSFDILGFSDKELGSSIPTKCRTLVEIRSALDSNDMKMPIHIFGCLDFFSILMYHICGADIFDGLNWFRYSYFNNVPIHTMNFGYVDGIGALDINDIYDISLIENINKINDFSTKLRIFSQDHDLSHLEIEDKVLDQLILLVKKSGIEWEE